MSAQILNRLRRRMLKQISRRCADHRAAHGQAPGDQIRIKIIAGANRQIDAFIDQIHRAVEHLQIDTHAGVKPDVRRDRIGQLRLAKRGADADPQQSARRVIGFADGGLHVVRQVDHLPAAREDFTAGGGQAQLARGAVHQPRANPVFQLRQIA